MVAMIVPYAVSAQDLSAKDRSSAALQKGLGIELAEDLDQAGDDPGPTRLMAGADPGAVVAVEVFVKQQIVAPMGIALECLGAAEHRPPSALVAQKYPGQPIGDFPGNLE